MKKFICSVVFLVSLAFFTGYALPMPFEDVEKPPSKEQMEKIRKRVETLKMWKLTKALDPDEETASRLFPLINEYDKKRLAVEQKIRKEMRKLRKSADTASEKELSAIIKRLEDNHRKLQNIRQEEFEELKDILTTREMAKYLIFIQDFDKEMKKILAEVRERRLKRLKNMPPGPPPE